MKISNEEFNRFWDEVLGEGWYDDCEDKEYSDDNITDLKEVCPRWQGSGRPEPKGLILARDIDGDFLAVSAAALFKRWRRNQTTTVIVASFEVPHGAKDTLITKIKELKGKVIA